MYKSCNQCKKLTIHTDKMNNRTGSRMYTCKVCGGTTKGLSSKRRMELEERKAEIYKEKTFDELLNSTRQEMHNNEGNEGN